MRNLDSRISWRIGMLIAVTALAAGCGDNDPVVDDPDPLPAMLTITPLATDFGSVTVGTSSAATTFTVTNAGEEETGAITPLITGANAGEFTAVNGCTTLIGGGACSITVTFSPSSAGAKSANVVVSGSPGGMVTAMLLATGQTPGELAISPSSLGYGNVTVGQSSNTQTFTITNDGTLATGVLSVTKAGSDPSEFTLADSCTGQSLAGGARCTVTAAFAPSSAGNKMASIVVTGSPDDSVNGALSGTGIAPARLTLSPTLQDFGSVVAGSVSGNVTLTVTNAGGVTSGPISQEIADLDANQFVIASGNCLGSTLAPQGTCNIIVRFTPSAAGSKAATIRATASPGGAASTSLLGTAVSAGQITISPTPHVFLDTTVGQTSTTQLFEVRNGGGSPTGALGTALGSTDPSHFTIVPGSNGCQGVILGINGTCTIAVLFSPTAAGTKAANLTVTGTPGGQVSASLGGLAIAPARFDISPASRDFGSVVTGTASTPQTFTVSNIGGQTSGIPLVAINGTDSSHFTMVNGCTAVLTAAGTGATSSCSVSVIFAPNLQGHKEASLDVSATLGGSDSAGLSGDGVSQAALAVNPTILSFPATLTGSVSTAQTFTVRNGGSVTTGVLTVELVGAHPGDFTQTNNCTDGPGTGVDTLIANAVCTVIVRFQPTARDLRTATVQVSGTPGGTVGVAVNGSSTPPLEILAPAPVAIPNGYTFPPSGLNPDAPTAVNVTVRNNTAASLTLTTVETDTTSSFAIVGGADCSGVRTAGTSCTFQVEFRPTALGALTGSYVLSSGVGGPSATQNVAGTGTTGTLTISDGDATPISHGFGSQNVGTSSLVRTFTVTNNGTSTTGMLSVDLSGVGFQIRTNTCSGTPLLDAASCTVGVIFTPGIAGTATGTLTVRATQGAPVLGGTVSATLSGNGTGATTPGPLTNVTTVAWGNVFAGTAAGATTDRTIVVTNPYAAATNVTLVLTGTAFTHVPATLLPCVSGGALAAGATCNIRVRFTSALPAGLVEETLTVSESFGGRSTTVALSATVRSTISLVAPPLPFTDVVVGTTSAQTISVHNDSLQTVTGVSVDAGGAPFFIPTSSCGMLTPGATCSFSLSFQPIAAGTLARTLVVTATNGSVSATVANTAITAAALTISPATFEFGSEIAGAVGSSQVFTVTNTGQQASGAVTAVLGAATHFTLMGTTCGAALLTNLACTVTVRFNPAAAAGTAAQSTTLDISAAPGATPTTSVPLTGTSVADGGLKITPALHTFANTTIGTSSSVHTFVVLNTHSLSAADLTVVVPLGFTRPAGVSFGTCVNGTGTLASGSTCTIGIKFEPTAASQQDGLLMANGTTFASLYGRGLSLANVEINSLPAAATAVTFADRAIGTTSATQTTTFKNVGQTAAVALTAVSTGSSEFQITNNCAGIALSPGTSCTVVAAFAPTTTGIKVRAIAFTGPVTATVTHTGTGLAPAALTITPATVEDDGSRVIGVADPLPTQYTITNAPGSADTGPMTFARTNSANYVLAASSTCALDGTQTLAGGASCRVDVSFNPTELGVQAGDVVVTGTPGGTVTARMTGTGRHALTTTTVSPFDAGMVAVGQTSVERTFTFTNGSQAATSLLQTTLVNTTGQDFSITDDGCGGRVLGAGLTCDIKGRFVPSGTPGPRTATLTVTGTVTGTTTSATISFTGTAL